MKCLIYGITPGCQTGVDRATLDFAIKHDIRHGGWSPKERKVEDGPLGSRCLLTETPSANYPQRTEGNVRDSDGSGTRWVRCGDHDTHRVVLRCVFAKTVDSQHGDGAVEIIGAESKMAIRAVDFVWLNAQKERFGGGTDHARSAYLHWRTDAGSDRNKEAVQPQKPQAPPCEGVALAEATELKTI